MSDTNNEELRRQLALALDDAGFIREEDGLVDSALLDAIMPLLAALSSRPPVPVTPAPTEVDILVEAIRLTVEYVGNDVLPAVEGWSWFDALMKVRPEVAQTFEQNPIRFPTPVTPQVTSDPNGSTTRDSLRAKLWEYLGTETYICDRDASAWGCGTMSLDDFRLAREDDEFMDSVLDLLDFPMKGKTGDNAKALP